MLANIEGLDRLEEIEKWQRERAREFIKFIEERREFLTELRDFYRFHAFSADFGDQEIELDYTSGRYMKCADSDGRVHFERTIPEDIPSEYLIEIIDDLFSRQPLSSLLQILEFSDWRNLSYLVEAGSKKHQERPPRNLREFLRECLEWAVLLTYAQNNRRVILLKDGLLRNKIFKRVANDPDCAYNRLQTKVESICRENESLIVGIAKSSKLLTQTLRYLEQTPTFMSQKGFILRVENDHALMQQSYTYDLYREGEVVFGNNLHLTRLKPGLMADIFTLEIPDFAEQNWDGVPIGRTGQFRDRSHAYVISLIAGLPKRTLPSRFNGAPEPLAKAHEFAHTRKVTAKGIEIKIRRQLRENEGTSND